MEVLAFLLPHPLGPVTPEDGPLLLLLGHIVRTGESDEVTQRHNSQVTCNDCAAASRRYCRTLMPVRSEVGFRFHAATPRMRRGLLYYRNDQCGLKSWPSCSRTWATGPRVVPTSPGPPGQEGRVGETAMHVVEALHHNAAVGVAIGRRGRSDYARMHG